MKKTFFKMVLAIIIFQKLFFSSILLFGQLSDDVKIRNTSILFNDDKVYIPYTLIGLPGDRYIVWAELFNQKNELLNAKSVTGDINQVYGSGTKQIVWDIKNDGFSVDENIYAKVYAKVITVPSTSKALVKSTVYPGWGDSQYNTKKYQWLKGFLGYSLAGASTYMYIKSNQSYTDYKNSNLPSSEDPSYKKISGQYQTSLILAGAAVVVWAWDYFGILSKSSKAKSKSIESFMTDDYYKVYSDVSLPKRINTRGLPPNLYADLSFTDENGDGILEANEKAMLNITISNQGKGDAIQLEVNVTDDTNDSNFIISNSNQQINLLKAGDSTSISIPISTNRFLKKASHKLAINVKESLGYDMDPAYLMLDALSYQPSQLVFSGYDIIDTGYGTANVLADGQLQAGEQVKAKLVIQNIGHGAAKNTFYSVNTTDPNIYITDNEGSIGNVKPGEIKEFFVTLSPNKRVLTKDNLPIFLSLKETDGNGDLKDLQLPIALNQSPPRSNIMIVQSDIESKQKQIARFEYSSNKFKTVFSDIVDISKFAPSNIKRAKSVGVIFGVSKYKELPPAPYANNDALIVKEYFEKVLGIEQVVTYTNEEVSGFIFDDVFNPDNGELLRSIIKGETELFVYYSGHGIPDKTGENTYLFPSDGKISRLDAQGYNIEKLYRNLSKLGAKHVTVILDACFSGASRKSQKIETENLIAQKGVKIRPKNTWLVDSNFTIISSSTGEETSLGFDASETGLFTYYLCAGLQGKADLDGDKTITLGELKKYVTENVVETSKKISGIQTPIFSGDESIIITKY